jgi:hypothetical protein
VFAVRRQGFGRIMYFAFRGKLGEPLDVIARLTAPAPAVLTLDTPEVEETEADFTLPIKAVLMVEAPMPDYEDMTLIDLRKLAQERDITGRSAMKRDELIAALREDDRKSPPGPSETKATTWKPNDVKDRL